jgi:hypothetical protein
MTPRLYRSQLEKLDKETLISIILTLQQQVYELQRNQSLNGDLAIPLERKRTS